MTNRTTIKRAYGPVGIIYWTTIIILLILGGYALFNGLIYAVDATIYILLATIIFVFKKDILFSWEGALFCCAAMLMNVAGMFGVYNLSAYGIGWDKFLHFIASMGIGLLAYAYLKHVSQANSDSSLNPLAIAILTFFIVSGVGALNEIIEFVGTRYFGFSEGMLGMTNGDIVSNSDLERFDTHWDLIVNSAGALIAIAYMTIKSGLEKSLCDKKTQ